MMATDFAPDGVPVAESFAPTTLATCADEPIHIPGAIQPSGFLLACDPKGDIFRVSANVDSFLGQTPSDVLRGTVESLLGEEVEHYRRRFLGNPWVPDCLDVELPHGSGRFTLHLVPSDEHLLIEGQPCLSTPEEQSRAQRQQARDISALRCAEDATEMLETAASVIARETGFNRTMIYRFDPEMNGEVIMEVVNGVSPRWLGHHFPHTDIPAQAQALYLRNRVRAIADIGAERIPLLGLPASLDKALDLSDSWFRAVSPLHIEYMENMGVRATLAMSLVVGKRLWGMVVCHHYANREVSATLRTFCDVLSQFVSARLEQILEQQTHRESARLSLEVDRIAQAMVDAPSLIDGAEDEAGLLEVFESDAFIMRLMGRKLAIGCTVPSELLDALEIHLEGREGFELMSTRSLGDWFEWPATDEYRLSGALCVPLSRNGEDFLLWLRSECAFEVAWAGDPSEGKTESSAGGGRLSPRRSFDTWVELVRGQSLPWTPAQCHAARLLGQKIRNELTTELRVSREREALMRRLAMHDDLTGLPSRRLLLDRVQQAIERSNRHQQSSAVMFLDLDGFKAVNDTFGHGVGDVVLREVAGRLGRMLRQIDTLARLGGDEFVALLEEIHSGDPNHMRAHILRIAEKLRATVADPVDVDGHEHRVTVSIGIAMFPQAAPDADGLLRAADRAMYEAKRAGKNQISWFVGREGSTTD